MELSASTIASFISIAGVVLAYMSFLKDKLKSAEDFGQLKQKVNTLEQQSRSTESRFDKIQEQLDDIKVTLTRIDTSVKNLTNN
jgi:septal ring factor EnvC (AmiA/AmiB activator)